MNSEPSLLPTRVSQFRGYIEGFWGTWLLHVGRELGLFEELRKKRMTAVELAESRGYEPAYTEVWCRAAQAFDFLSGSSEDGYALAAGWEPLFDTAGAWATTYVQVSQRVYESLEAVFLGKAFPEPSLSLRILLSEGLKTSYAWLWHEMAPRLQVLASKLSDGGRLVEFGCGTGTGLELLKQAYPQLELTGIEQDYDCAREAERATRAVIVVGTAEECRYQSRFDIAVFHRSLVHCERPRRAIERAAASLRPGGLLVISTEAAMPAGRCDHRSQNPRLRLGERFFFQMFLAPDAIQSLTLEDIEEWCREEGLQLMEMVEAPDHGSPTLVYNKPAEES
ncbi:MAG: methyltransferase domain-containing protein [Armatimonadetes bacterium]|nr:methyltransferase domain-containing protein [Armatimonadota bacterium]